MGSFLAKSVLITAILFSFFSASAQITPDANGIIYVKETATGLENGNSWANATSDLHNAIHATGVTKVFVAIGNYNVGDNSFIMKNNVEIYGGFDPDNGITDLSHNRIMPNPANTQGSVLDGENVRPVVWNVFTAATAMNNTAVLDGFTVMNGNYSNGAGIRNLYASPTLRNLVIRNNTATSSGAGIYNDNSSPVILNTVINGNSINGAFAQSSIGAGVYNGTNSIPTIINTTITDNRITGIGAAPVMVGAGVANLNGAAPEIYNSIIWNNRKNNEAAASGADIENISAGITLKNSITQSYSTGNSGDNNLVGVNPLFADNSFTIPMTSPAVNKGNNSYLSPYGGTEGTDLAGNPRLSSQSVDIGAYEYQLNITSTDGIVYVKQTGIGDGSSWEEATGWLHDAIHTNGVQKVFVAIGNYNVGDNSFIMKNGVEIYGGFDPDNNIATLDDNRILPNQTAQEGSVLNGQNARPVIWNVFTSGTAMDSTAVLDGFTLKNGYTSVSDGGGGISNKYASPTLRNLVIKNNQSYFSGGGITNKSNSSPNLSNVIIKNNTAITGGGMYNYAYSNPILNNVDFIENQASGGGGFSNGYRSYVVYTNGTVQGNTAQNAGGGIEHYNSDEQDVLMLTNVSVTGNNSGGSGGGIWSYGHLVCNKVIIKGNSSDYYGGGIYQLGEHLTLEQVLIANNETDENGGGGLYLEGSSSYVYDFKSSTIVNNLPQAIYSYNSAPVPVISNSIIVGDIEGGITYNAQYSFVNDPNITAEDLFTNPAAKDYTLKTNSPAIDAGNNAFFIDLDENTTDLAGNPRLAGSSIDRGAYEYISPFTDGIIYVKETATGNGTGTSWDNATSDLHNAIHNAEIQKVFVAIGNYNVGDHSFIMKNNVEIYGGFDPDNGIEDLNDNRILPTETLNGSVLNGQGTRAVIWNDFSPANALNNSAKLDGFTITNGDSFGNGEEGGGMHNVNASVTLNNLIIKNNWAYYGAGLYNWGGAPVLNNVIITDNHAMFGGAMSNKETAPVLTNVIIKNNTAQYGGGFYNLTASPILINTLMYNNIDGVSGSNETMYNRQSSVPVLINSTVVGNIHNSEGSSISFSNAIFYGEIDGNGSYTAEYSLIKGNTNTSNGNLDGTGMYLGTIFNNLSEEDYTLKNGSPAINAGNNALFTGLDENTEDLSGNPRVQNFADGGIIDLGAYESPYEGLTPDASGIIYVNTAISGDGSGKDWNNTTSNLHNAIHANGVQKVFVATGNYNVGANSFIMKNGVEIYGGFDPDNNIKTLDDERILPNRGTAEGSVLNGQNVRPVIWNVFTSGTALNTSAVLDGFTVMNGLGNTDGGGIRNIYASPTLRNLVVKNNSLSSTFDTYGGGIFNGAYCSPVITNVIIKGNTAKFGGGLFTNGNTCEPVLTNVLIVDNIGTLASQYGGAYESGKATYTNVTIAGNTAKQLYVNNSNTQLNNVIVWGANTGGISTGIIQNSLISGFTGTANGNIDATGITETDIFTNPSTGDYTLKNGSPAVNAGNNAFNSTSLDLAGNPRIYNYGIIDLGAYESEYNPNTSLPITLLLFTAHKQNKTTELQWVTASEQNNKGFEIEHSTNGSSWINIGYINTKAINGNSSSLLNYNFTHDNSATGKNYYRLKQVDYDGKFEYSAVRMVSFDVPTAISIYPNPAKDVLNVKSDFIGSGYVIYDARGRQIVNGLIEKQLESINIKSVSPGLYFIVIITPEGEKVNEKFIKQ